MKTIQKTLVELQAALAAEGFELPPLEARLLLQAATGLSHEDLFMNLNRLITDSESQKLEELSRRRLAREPLSRISGKRDFWKHRFNVSRETLDPRADSETLIEMALKHAGRSQPLRILDLGTGTGCLLLSLLQELPQATGVGVDISPGAVATARQNAAEMGLSARAAFMASDWQALAAEEAFDVVLSNPPYIASAEIATLAPEVRDHDPRRALDGGADGLDCYRQIAALLGRVLDKKGHVFLEIGATQAAAVQELLAERGYYVLEVGQDLGGNDRCIVARPRDHQSK